MTVDPARVGANEIHLYLFDAKTGAPYAKVKELTVDRDAARQGHRPLPLEPQLSGPGHYTIPDALLNAPGDWEIDVTLRVSEFDQFAKKRSEVAGRVTRALLPARRRCSCSAPCCSAATRASG